METVKDRIERAQASGNLEEVHAALMDAQAAGADKEQIQVALDEIKRLKAQKEAEAIDAASAAAGFAPPSRSGGGSSDAAEGAEVDEAAAAAAAAELRAKAEAFKLQGNERLKGNTKSSAREALDCFTRGLEVHCSDLVLNAQLHSNRAHVRILLRQFVEAVDDCRKAIELDPKNLKSYFRAAKASMQLDLIRNGVQFCEQGLLQKPDDADLLKLRDSCAEKLASQQQRKTQQAPQSSAAANFNADEAMAVQDKVNELGEKVEILKGQILAKGREKAKVKLTHDSLEEMPAETPMYASCGRCFILSDRSTCLKELKETSEKLEEELPKLTKAHEELEKRKTEAETELREIIQAFKRNMGPETPAIVA
eukprot:gnl/TRDRNA2_/TRDRNA2_195771_c0_seq1.p1 gnl/TRDRNA2_/TRDRNA2_195771_c0~~gnl/TRDRNA2_/TRDRNA2_195771_c0_seq1.p1  ORF type:complete len:367 (-),score=128.96 gnl/TRDRNA2_/TRDRNA2_195771_c0_seq1:75-1175(-)